MRRTWVIVLAGVLATVLAVGGAIAVVAAVFWPWSAPDQPAVVQVTLTDDARGAEKNAVAEQARDVPGATNVEHHTREEAYRRFKRTFKDKPELVEAARPEDFPEMYVFRVSDRPEAKPGLRKLRELPGVEKVRVLVKPSGSPRPS